MVAVFNQSSCLRNIDHSFDFARSLFFIFKGNILQKKAATIWLISIIAMHAIPFKEVRYLAFLSPLSAVIIFPAIESILSLKNVV